MMNLAKTCLAMAAALCIVEGVEASPLGWLVKSMFRQNEKAEHERQNREFESMMRDWTDFARTNLSVETTASFRDKVLVPFVRKEMPNPFSPGGKMSNEPWAAEANAMRATKRNDTIPYCHIYMQKSNFATCEIRMSIRTNTSETIRK